MNGVIDSAALQKVRTKLITSFQGGVDSGNEGIVRVAPKLWHEEDAIGETEVDIVSLAGSGRLKQWKTGEPQERQRLSVNKLKVGSDRYSLLIELQAAEVESNVLKPYLNMAKVEGADASDWEEEQTANTLTAGFDDDFDDGSGKKFFDTGRPVAPKATGGQTYDNLIAAALSSSTYATARETLFGMKDASGRSKNLGRRGFALIVAGNLEGMGMDIVKVANQAGGATNKWQGTADLEVWNWLPDDIAFLVAKSPKYRPVQKVNFAKLRTAMTGVDFAIENDVYLWQVLCRMGFHLLSPECIVGFNP